MDEIVPFREIPDDQFDAFFSYRNNDEQQTFVRQLIFELHTRYGLKCCDHDLDFKPGVDIITNINNNINNSSRTVIILSKDYLESQWCQYEMKTVITMSVQQHKRFITLVTEKCEIPQSLLTDTYIDATGEMNSWIKKLVDAIKTKDDDTNATSYRLSFPFGTAYSNLDVIHKETTSAPCSPFAFPGVKIPDYISRCGIESEDYNLLIKRLASQRIVNRRHICNPLWPVLIVCYFVVPLGVMAAIAFFLSYTDDFRPVDLIIGIPFLIVDLIGIAWPCCCFYNNGKDYISSNQLVVSPVDSAAIINETNSVDPIDETLVKVVLDDDGVEDDVTFDDNEPLLHKENLSNDPSFQLLCVSFEYFEDYLAGKLLKSSGRHAKNASCLCEYWEQIKRPISEIIEV